MIFRIGLDEALARRGAAGAREMPEAEKDSNATPGAVVVARSEFRVAQVSVARDGKRLAFVSGSPSQREEKVETIELYLVSLAGDAAEVTPSRLTHNEAVEKNRVGSGQSAFVFSDRNRVGGEEV